MKWALKNDERILAEPKSKAKCPICNDEVISKCGSIKIWHWSHKANKDCDNWYEPETEWHLNWKNEFPKECQEFTMGKHRADIRTNDRWIIELQNSSISSEDIIEREKYYKRMIWLLNGETLGKGLILKKKNGIITFRWKNPPKSWWNSKKEIYVDFSDKQKEKSTWIEEYTDYSYYWDEVYNGRYDEDEKEEYGETYGGYYKIEGEGMDREIFYIKKIYHNIPCGGWGILISKEDFLSKFKGKENDIKTIKEP